MTIASNPQLPLPPEQATHVLPPSPVRGWLFIPLAPLVVVLVGLAVACGIGIVGLDHLARAGEEHASARAALFASAVGARLSQIPESGRQDAVQLAARRTAAEFLVVTSTAKVVHDATLAVPSTSTLEQVLTRGQGVAQMRLGRARFIARPFGDPQEDLRLIVFVTEPRTVKGVRVLVVSLVALAVMLLGVAAAVAYAVSRDVTRDIDFVTYRVREMAHVRTEPTGELIPARTMDGIGMLTKAFNRLVERFSVAEKEYRHDLARASAADRDRAAFLAAVSHELRSPLNAILGFADILMTEVDGPLPPAAREDVEQIRGSGEHLKALINDILEFSALESGQLRLSRSRVDLTTLAENVVREASVLIGDKPLVVRTEAEEPIFARVDARRMRQVLGNLVNNAIKFTQRGEVVVRVRTNGKTASLTVSDTGPGISKRERDLIFKEYKQASGERVKRRGTGLGLAIARRLVMLHRGTISVESTVGRGATFTVLLPIDNVDEAATPKGGRPR